MATSRATSSQKEHTAANAAHTPGGTDVDHGAPEALKFVALRVTAGTFIPTRLHKSQLQRDAGKSDCRQINSNFTSYC